MSLSLQQRQTQQLKLTPAQLQAIKMLEVPACELQQRINEELQENPALEEGRGNDNSDSVNDNDNLNENDNNNEDEGINEAEDFIETAGINEDGDDYDDDFHESREPIIENTLSTSLTLFDYLKQQIYLTKMTKPERHIAKWIIGNIDEDGFLRRTNEQLVDDLAFQEGLVVPDDQMKAIVQQIKNFDPSGVAAYNLQECLINQLLQRESTESVKRALAILRSHFDAFSRHQYARIQQSLSISEEQLKEAINEITRLNQKPANAFTGNTAESRIMTIIPDFVVENRDGDLVILLNDGDIPALHVSEEYSQMLQTYTKDSTLTKSKQEAARFIRTKIEAAATFIDAIRQRNETLSRTMRAIVAYQHEFFIEGGAYNLKPLRMADISAKTGYDISTISRVCNAKYVQTEYGIFPLKYFFNDSTTNNEGEEITTKEVKHILEELINHEDKTNPLTDDQLVTLLNERGYSLARRTVAKYRDLMNIPVARLRKAL